MKKNMGSTDKFIRWVLAAIMVGLFLTHVVEGAWGVVMLVLAAIFILTSLVSVCPLYIPFGINTCKKSA